MNLKKKLKAFFTFKRRRDGGFTLVELIVVIAILAILAGVAVPAYNGYIKKARESKDQLLIAAVNEAFTAACLETGVEQATVTDAKISVVGQCVFGVSSVMVNGVDVSEEKLTDIYNSFDLYFAGNFETPFQTENVLSLAWMQAEHSFKMDHVNGVPTVVMLSTGMTTIPADVMSAISASYIGNLNKDELNTMFTTMQDGAVTTLVGTVDSMVDKLVADAGGWKGAALKAGFEAVKLLTDDRQFGAYIALQSTGLKNNKEIFGDRYDYINNTLKDRNATKAEKDAAMNEFSNAMLLYTANVMNGQNPTAIHTAVKDSYFTKNADGSDKDLVSTGGNGAKVVSAAIRESVYQGYIKTSEGAEAYKNATGTEAEKKAVLTATDGFKDYLNSEQCGNDIAGLVATLGTVQSNKEQIGIDTLVQQGMSNEDALSIFDAVTTG